MLPLSHQGRERQTPQSKPGHKVTKREKLWSKIVRDYDTDYLRDIVRQDEKVRDDSEIARISKLELSTRA